MSTKTIDKSNKDNRGIIINTPDKQVNNIANNYIQTYNINVKQSTGFTSLLMTISNNIKVDRNNIDMLIYYFDIYVSLCSQCEVLPDMLAYSLFIDVPYDTVKDWLSGERKNTSSKIYMHTFKKFRNYCKSTCVAEASRGNVGAIYISKAIHGLSDAPPPPTYTQNNLYINAPTTREAIAAEFGLSLPDNSGASG